MSFVAKILHKDSVRLEAKWLHPSCLPVCHHPLVMVCLSICLSVCIHLGKPCQSHSLLFPASTWANPVRAIHCCSLPQTCTVHTDHLCSTCRLFNKSPHTHTHTALPSCHMNTAVVTHTAPCDCGGGGGVVL